MQYCWIGVATGLLLGSMSVLADDFVESGALSEVRSLDTVGEAFMPAPEWRSVDVEALQGQLRKKLSDDKGDGVSIFHPDADNGPLSKALLVALHDAPALPHVRYRLRYAQARVIPEGAGAPLEISLVEVLRLNLGSARRAELVEMLGEERVAPPEQFGVGPDIAWRLVTHPLMGQAAEIAQAAQREVLPREAPNCFGIPCRQSASLNAEAREWPEPVMLDTHLDESLLELSLLEAGLERLGLQRDAQGMSRWHSPEWPESVAAGEPFIEISLERGLGQDDGMDLVLHYDQLMDHETRALWERLMAFPAIPGQPAMVFMSQDRELWPRPEW